MPFFRSIIFIIILFVANNASTQDSLVPNDILSPGKDPFESLKSNHLTQEELNITICDLLVEAKANKQVGLNLEAIRQIQLALFLEKQLEKPTIETFELNSYAGGFISSIDLRYALEFYRKATKIISQIPELEAAGIFSMYTSRAGVHGLLIQKDSAVYYYRKAIEIAVNDSPTAVISSINNLGVFYHGIAMYDSAKVYFEKALQMMGSENNNVGLHCAILDNLAQLDLHSEKYWPALKTFQFNDSVYLSRNLHNKYVINKVRLMETMLKLDLPGIQEEILSLQFFINRFSIHIKPKEVLKFYRFANEFYHDSRMFELSKEYQERYIASSDSLSTATAEQLHLLTQSLLAIEEVSFSHEMKVHQLAADKAKLQLRSAQRIILISLISAVIIVILLLLYFKKRRQELMALRQMAESELKNKEMETKLMEQELILKKRDLTNLVLHNTQVYDSNHRLIERLHGITHQKENLEKDIRSLLIELQSQNQLVEKAVMLQANIDSLNEEFYQKLRAQFPELSKAETELCGFIRINLSSKDISVLKNVGAPSVKTSKNRLRKKLGIAPEEDIYEFVKLI
ncbi:MAG TPA: hypothetical protein VMZ69_00490 [Saprospiraceae bacterium]|nr:hypothetical protein [Saprospiraceae bacterium]